MKNKIVITPELVVSLEEVLLKITLDGVPTFPHGSTWIAPLVITPSVAFYLDEYHYLPGGIVLNNLGEETAELGPDQEVDLNPYPDDTLLTFGEDEQFEISIFEIKEEIKKVARSEWEWRGKYGENPRAGWTRVFYREAGSADPRERLDKTEPPVLPRTEECVRGFLDFFPVRLSAPQEITRVTFLKNNSPRYVVFGDFTEVTIAVPEDSANPTIVAKDQEGNESTLAIWHPETKVWVTDRYGYFEDLNPSTHWDKIKIRAAGEEE